MHKDETVGVKTGNDVASTEAPSTADDDNAVLEELVGPARATGHPPPTAQPPPVQLDQMQVTSSTDESDFRLFYGLKDNPFPDSVNPAFFYKTNSHELAYVRMTLAVRNDVSLGLVTGPSGTGKTLISQMVLQNLDPAEHVPAVVLVSPAMSKMALLKEILNELGLELPDQKVLSAQDLLNVLQSYIIDLYQKGQKLVLLIDECHFLAADSLHMLRTISNIEVPEHKLSTCLLFAEDRFLKRLRHPSYESLRNRIYLHGELKLLSAEDCKQYIKFRLLRVGRMHDLFDDSGIAALHERAGGVCRRINKLGMLALIEGTLRRHPMITSEVISACQDTL